MTNDTKENEKFLGVIHLLNEGYTIKRAEQDEDDQAAAAVESKP